MRDAYIKSIGYYVPEGRIGNERIMELFKDANAGWISEEQYHRVCRDNKKRFEFLGLQTRSSCKNIEDENSVENATRACRSALDKSGISPEQIDCLIMTGISNPFREPTFANVIARNLGVNAADFFDVNDTCNGFLKTMEIAALYIQSGKCRNVLIGTCENPYEFGLYGPGLGEDFTLDHPEDLPHKFSIFTIGSGAGAMVLGAGEGVCKFKNYAETRETETWDVSWYTLPYLNTPPTIYGKKVRGYWTDARRIASGVLKNMPAFVKSKIAEWKFGVEDIDFVISHQLGNNITGGTLEKLGIARDKAPVNTFSEFGNMASANIPVNLGLAVERGLFKSGNRILVLGSGGGLSMLIAELEWQ